MLKAAFERLGLSTSSKLEPAKQIESFLSSPTVVKILEAQDRQLIVDRQRHATELLKLREREAALIPELDDKLAQEQAGYVKVRKEYFEAEQRLRSAMSERSVFLAQSAAQRAIHEKELVETAPHVDKAISKLLDLMEANQNLQISESITVKTNVFGARAEQKIRTNARAAKSWYQDCADAIQQLRALKLEPDHTKFESKIEAIFAKIHDPQNFPDQTIVVDGATGKITEEKA
jgi:hypothetical protein